MCSNAGPSTTYRLLAHSPIQPHPLPAHTCWSFGALHAYPRCLGAHINAGVESLEENNRAGCPVRVKHAFTIGGAWHGGLALMLSCQGQSNEPISNSQATLQQSTLQHRVVLPLPPSPTILTVSDAAGLAPGEVTAGWPGAMTAGEEEVDTTLYTHAMWLASRTPVSMVAAEATICGDACYSP